jgi:hypothetical protein
MAKGMAGRNYEMPPAITNRQLPCPVSRIEKC